MIAEDFFRGLKSPCAIEHNFTDMCLNVYWKGVRFWWFTSFMVCWCYWQYCFLWSAKSQL